MLIQIVTITIKDQFGSILHSIYNGENIVQEKFNNVTNGVLTTVWTPIVLPENRLIDGIKYDQTGFSFYTTINVKLEPDDIALWTNLQPIPEVTGEHNNAFSLRNFTIDTEGDMELKVDGHKVNPDYHRRLRLQATDYPPSPFECTDTVIK